MDTCACGRAIQPVYAMYGLCEDCYVSANYRYWPTRRIKYHALQGPYESPDRRRAKRKTRRQPASLREMLE